MNKPMFTKILIANRGEIACRVIRTARRMGIVTVAVYSDADARSLHVRLADEAVHIGGSASADSYLKGDVIIEAAKKTGAQAIHPGYGFLSENKNFSAACKKAGIVFIGPAPDSIEAMGLKDKAKEIMSKAGVPVVPGYMGDKQDAAFLKKEAAKTGYPVLIKAVAGGGGKGMRLIENESQFDEGLASCQREAEKSFGNAHVLIERYITRPRHVEVQVFGDGKGGGVYLFERDCSLQRRHQKVVEEAPAPGLPEKVRKALGETAVKAVKALKYANAGTIEFIMDSKTHEFFFMEMNTRLQVEHPVTEAITGLDLVEWQLRIAAGQGLPLTQEQVKLNGHAFEVRLYAEDPASGFLPQTGRLTSFIHAAHARTDTGVEAGDSVTIHYDPMIAKLITHATTREAAAKAMHDALSKTIVAGLTTNQEFLGNIFAQADFLKGDVDTGFIARHEKDLLPATYGRPDNSDIALACIYMLSGLNRLVNPADPWAQRDNWRLNGTMSTSMTFVNREEKTTIQVCCTGNSFDMTSGKDRIKAQFISFDGLILSANINGMTVSGCIVAQGHDLTLCRNGRVMRLHQYMRLESEDAGEGAITAPMPGKIVNVMVKKGQNVDRNQPLLVMEAMKMEMTIRAGCAGVVDELPVSAGQQVQDGALLVSITEKAAA